MYKYRSMLGGSLNLLKKSEFFKNKEDFSKFKITDLFIIKEFITGINKITELVHLQDQNIILENEIAESTREYNNAIVVILYYRKVLKTNIQKKIDIYYDYKINLENYKNLTLEKDEKKEINQILDLIKSIITNQNHTIDKLSKKDYTKNLDIIKKNIQSFNRNDKDIEDKLKTFCEKNNSPFKKTLCEKINVYHKSFYLESYQYTANECIISLSGEFMISINETKDNLKEKIQNFYELSDKNDNVINWINPIKRKKDWRTIETEDLI